MEELELLGPAAVDRGRLHAIVAALLGIEEPALSDVVVERVPYELPAITTAGRFWVSGKALVEGVFVEWRLFVKHVQNWSRSPLFQFVPEELREAAAEMVPWRTEAAAYRSELGDHLPDGLAMARAVAVVDLDELSQAVWMECVPVADVTWDLPRYEHAAYLLGRLAASPAVAAYAHLGDHDVDVRRYADGRLSAQVIPMLRADDLWRDPALAGTFGALRPRLLAAAARLDDLMSEWTAFPVLTGHGDACPNNLLVRPDRESFTLIDFGFWGALPLGFDLGQLLVGDVQLGLRSTDDLADRDDRCVRAYHRGLADEGLFVPLEGVRRAHALQMVVFSGLSAFIADDVPGTAGLETRAELARYVLDQLDATAS